MYRGPIHLIGAAPEARDVMTFRFDRATPAIEWRAGQNLVMTIPGLEDPRGPTRPFTISSSPTEGSFLAITTIIRASPFKRRLEQMIPGGSVEFEGIEGEFFLEPGRPAVMIAGGIGVTPFRSMLRFAADTHLEKPLVLLYSCKTPEDIVFRKELDELPVRNRAIRVLYTITRPEESHMPWTGRVGRIDASFVKDALRGIRHPLIYIAGPPALVREARKIAVDEVRVSPEDVRTDEFDGY